MASRLVYMKSVSLLPKSDEAEQLKQELTGELLEYQLCKEMAVKLSQRTAGFDTFVRRPMALPINKEYRRKHEAQELIDAYFSAVGRGMRKLPPPIDSFSPIVARKIVSVASKVIHILRGLRSKSRIRLQLLYESAESRSELVATFLAVLELIRAKRVYVSGANEKAALTVYASKGEKSS
ncbi:MAG: serine protease, partial [Clostridia bacterium]|nr:serine protease [Clostridia bacterium]